MLGGAAFAFCRLGVCCCFRRARVVDDPAQTFRVLDLQIARGDIRIYLTAGVLAFTKPISGHIVAAVFTTIDTDAGDGEVLVLPPTRGERAALASFTKSPNMDEHFSSAVFFFSDETAQELQAELADPPLHPAPEQGQALAATVDKGSRPIRKELDVRIAESLLDSHPPERGFFYGIIGGRTVGVFDVVYEPARPESVLVGRLASGRKAAPGISRFGAASNRAASRRRLMIPAAISNYSLDTVIRRIFPWRRKRSSVTKVPLPLAAW